MYRDHPVARCVRLRAKVSALGCRFAKRSQIILPFLPRSYNRRIAYARLLNI